MLYVATALSMEDPELERRVAEHRARRPAAWETLELGGGDLDAVFEASGTWGCVLLDSLTLWVSARSLAGETEEATLAGLDLFLERASASAIPFVLVSDEVGLGVVPESAEGRRFRDLLGLANRRVAAAAQEVWLCVAGIGLRVR